MSDLSTPAFNQWQLYFKGDNNSVIAGYIRVFITLFGILGAYVVGEIKVTKTINFLMYSYVLIFLTLTLSVVDNLYVSLFFFFLHAMILSASGVIQFTYLNTLLNKNIRTSLLSLSYSIEALITVFIIELGSVLFRYVEIGSSWIILGRVGVCFSIGILFIFKEKGYTIDCV